MSTYQEQKELILSDDELKVIRLLMGFIYNEYKYVTPFDNIFNFIDKTEFDRILNKIKGYTDKK